MTRPDLRVLFCIGISQSFFDLPADGVTTADVWQATMILVQQIKELPGVTYLADFDDDAHMVGPSEGWPWTCYLLADVDSQETVKAACNFLRTITVGDSEFRFWKYARIEARMGRPLTVRTDVGGAA